MTTEKKINLYFKLTRLRDRLWWPFYLIIDAIRDSDYFDEIWEHL